MALFVVFDGFDSAGKSTLVQKVLETFPEAICINKARELRASKQQMNWWQNPMFLTKIAQEQLFVLDRCYATNICYGQMRGEDVTEWHKQKSAFESLHKVLNIYLQPPFEMQKLAFADDGIDLDAEQVACVCQAYRVLASQDAEVIYTPRIDSSATSAILQRVYDHLQRPAYND